MYYDSDEEDIQEAYFTELEREEQEDADLQEQMCQREEEEEEEWRRFEDELGEQYGEMLDQQWMKPRASKNCMQKRSKRNSNRASFTSLPSALQLTILNKVDDKKDVLNVAKANRHFRQLAYDKMPEIRRPALGIILARRSPIPIGDFLGSNVRMLRDPFDVALVGIDQKNKERSKKWIRFPRGCDIGFLGVTLIDEDLQPLEKLIKSLPLEHEELSLNALGKPLSLYFSKCYFSELAHATFTKFINEIAPFVSNFLFDPEASSFESSLTALLTNSGIDFHLLRNLRLRFRHEKQVSPLKLSAFVCTVLEKLKSTDRECQSFGIYGAPVPLQVPLQFYEEFYEHMSGRRLVCGFDVPTMNEYDEETTFWQKKIEKRHKWMRGFRRMEYLDPAVEEFEPYDYRDSEMFWGSD
ncbi:hypothetical protein AAVH_24541 [Aphelenchoides avenae]|nr:hypothetical protein AAVH_24541 [Aphelenchus avenae]